MRVYKLYINMVPGLLIDGNNLVGTFTTMGGSQAVINFVERKYPYKVESIEIGTDDNSVLYSFKLKMTILDTTDNYYSTVWTGYVVESVIDEW